MVSVAVTALAAGACGGTAKYANEQKPPLPINVTVYISDGRVSVSPSAVGAGPVVFEVSNHASQAESLAIMPAGGGSQPLASTAPINPQGTTQVAVNLGRKGSYSVRASGGSTDASLNGPGGITPATILVGTSRPGSRDVLLTP
jgi:hypothetical protein